MSDCTEPTRHRSPGPGAAPDRAALRRRPRTAVALARLAAGLGAALAFACSRADEDAALRALEAQSCSPCPSGTLPLSAEQRAPLLAQLDPAWQVDEAQHLSRSFAFANFREGLEFVHRVGEVAERLDHHPDLLLRWGEVRVELWTHSIEGLHYGDFALAAHCDRIRSQL
jgi:4a-hydroxytetrahydrobiopterin dehydratase